MRHFTALGTALGVLLTGIIFVAAPAKADLFQRHGDGKLWKYDGRGQCSDTACPGWLLIDQNPATQDVADGFGGLYQLHKDGKIWRYDGRGQCTTNACPGWTLIDKNPSTKAIAGGPNGFFQRHADGQIWKYNGHGLCTTNQCSDWILIDKNPNTREIVAANGTLFQHHQDGKVWRYDGRGQCSQTACPGWILIDKNAQTQSIAGASGGFYQRHGDGQIWKYDGGGQCTDTACPGWTQIDKNPATQTIVAGGRDLYQLHSDGKFWKYDGRGACSATACPGWLLIDKNAATREISANQETVFQRHVDGKLWKYDGRGQCSETGCPGWTLIDKNSATVSVVAIESTPNGPILGDLVAGSVVAGLQAEQDSTNRVLLDDRTSLSQASLCNRVLMPPPPSQPLGETIRSTVAEQLSHTPFHMRSDSNVTVGPCSAHAELDATGSANLRIVLRIPQNRLSLMLTTPDVHVVGISIGAPGSLDPHVIYTFDIDVHAIILVPPRSGTPLRVENATASVTNAHLDPVNVTAGAAVAINDVQALITGHDFVKKLTDNRSLALDGLASSLNAVNSALNLLPPNEPLVYGYDRGRQTLIARTFQ